jgi:hypothetical protein
VDRPNEGWTVPLDILNDDELNERPNGQVFEKFAAVSMDRGHLVPNSDVKSHQEKLSTFSVINRAPQIAAVNRGAWRCVENAVRRSILPTDDKSAQVDYYKNKMIIILTLLVENDVKVSETGGPKVGIPASFNRVLYVIGNDPTDDTKAIIEEGFCITQTNDIGTYIVELRLTNQAPSALPQLSAWSTLGCSKLNSKWPQPVDTQKTDYMELIDSFLFKNKKLKCSVFSTCEKFACEVRNTVNFYSPNPAFNKRNKDNVAFHFSGFNCPQGCKHLKVYFNRRQETVAEDSTATSTDS